MRFVFVDFLYHHYSNSRNTGLDHFTVSVPYSGYFFGASLLVDMTYSTVFIVFEATAGCRKFIFILHISFLAATFEL